MARGIMYNACLDPDDIGSFGEGSLYDYLEALSCDYVADRPAEEAEDDLRDLIKYLSPAFAPYIRTEGQREGEGWPEGCAFVLSTPGEDELDAAKRAWFQPYLDALKRKVADMDIDGFVQSSKLYELSSCIDDEYSDAVWFNNAYGSCWYTVMDFLRHLSPDTDYWFASNAVLLH